MDWSLLQPDAKKRFLRDVRAFKNPNWYYLAMIIDPILRFNWIFYAIYTHDLQHSTICSFLVALSEVTRRGMWTAFRVENEHCSNVARFKASRDVPLPYDLETAASSQESLPADQNVTPEGATTAIQSRASPALSRLRSHTSALERQSSTSTMRRPQRSFTRILADAHTQDFEKKRKPGAGDSDNLQNMRRDGSPIGVGRENSSDSDDEDEDEEQEREDVLDAETLLSQGRVRRGESRER